MPTLVAKLDLDTRDYQRGMDRADKLADKFVHKQEKFLTKSFFHAFGIGAAVHEFKSALDNADRIASESAKNKLSPERFQALESVAKSTGATIEQLLEFSKKLPPEIAKAADEFERMGHAIPSSTLAQLVEMRKAGSSLGEQGEGLAGRAMSFLWTGLKRMGFFSFGAANSLLGSVGNAFFGGGDINIPGLGTVGQSAGDYWLNALFGDAEGMSESDFTYDHLNKILTLKKIKRAEDLKKLESASKPPEISAFHPEIFDSLNKIGGFGQRGTGQSQTALDRIARATEATADNTKNNTPY